MNKLREKLFETYDAHYMRGNAVADYGQHMPDYEAAYGKIVATLPRGAEVLDLGCGAGFLLFWLERSRPGFFRLTGVDKSESQLTHTRKQLAGAVKAVREEGASFLERNPNLFSAIFCTHMLEHMESDEELLELMELAKRALVPGGWFICDVPNMANLTAMQLRYIDLTHSRGFTELSLLQLLECAGFQERRIIRRKAADISQAMRMFLEDILHRGIYLVCGDSRERHFGRTIIGVGKA